jgi:HAD superfamily hydrolase (TIGR01490 family)
MSLHLFDVDYTLVRKSTGWYFLQEALAGRHISLGQLRTLPWAYISYKLGLAREDFIEQAVRPLAGIDRQVLEALSRSYFTRRLKPNIYADAVKCIRALQSRGGEVYLATSSLDCMIRPLERFLAVSGALCSELEFTPEGKTSGQLAGPALFGGGKKAAVEAWLQERAADPGELSFYSDSYTDLPLLEFCGHPVAVNPDRFLRREALRRGWQIMFFQK